MKFKNIKNEFKPFIKYTLIILIMVTASVSNTNTDLSSMLSDLSKIESLFKGINKSILVNMINIGSDKIKQTIEKDTETNECKVWWLDTLTNVKKKLQLQLLYLPQNQEDFFRKSQFLPMFGFEFASCQKTGNMQIWDWAFHIKDLEIPFEDMVICLPKICTYESWSVIMNDFFSGFGITFNVLSMNLKQAQYEASMKTESQHKLTKYLFYGCIIFFSVIAVLITLISTVKENKMKKREAQK